MYAEKVLRNDGKSTKTMTYQSRPDVKIWDATFTEQATVKDDAFQLAWRHVERAPDTEELSPFGKGFVSQRHAGDPFCHHGRKNENFKFRRHTKRSTRNQIDTGDQ